MGAIGDCRISDLAYYRGITCTSMLLLSTGTYVWIFTGMCVPKWSLYSLTSLGEVRKFSNVLRTLYSNGFAISIPANLLATKDYNLHLGVFTLATQPVTTLTGQVLINYRQKVNTCNYRRINYTRKERNYIFVAYLYPKCIRKVLRIWTSNVVRANTYKLTERFKFDRGCYRDDWTAFTCRIY